MKDIIQGHINEVVGNNKELQLYRLSICEECELFVKKSKQCNPFIWVNITSGETTRKKMKGHKDWVRGCGCRLKAKTTLPNAKCPINKW